MKIALVCIAKNEDRYIEEWIDYHLKLGFEHVFIYENNWKANISRNRLTKISFNGDKQQIPAYNHFIRRYRNEFEWAAFLDVDEFLVLKKHANIGEFIEEFKDETAVGINWVLFGDNGHKLEEEYSVIKRFTKRQSSANIHIKSIVNLSKINMMYVHTHGGEWVDTRKRRHERTPFNKDPIIDVAQINHYFVKTREEFILKRERGMADNLMIRSMNEFDSHNINEVEDLLAYNFMYGYERVPD